MEPRGQITRCSGGIVAGRSEPHSDIYLFDEEAGILCVVDLGSRRTELDPLKFETEIEAAFQRLKALTPPSSETESPQRDPLLVELEKELSAIKKLLGPIEDPSASISFVVVDRLGGVWYAHAGSARIYQWLSSSRVKRCLSRDPSSQSRRQTDALGIISGRVELGTRDMMLVATDGFWKQGTIFDQFMEQKHSDQMKFLAAVSEQWGDEDGTIQLVRLDAPWYTAQTMGFSKAAEAISSSVIFKNLSENEVRSILEIALERSFEASEFVIKKGEDGHSLFVLVSGSVDILARGKSRGVVKEPGTCFGEISFLDRHPRSASLKVVEPAQFLEVSFSDLDGLMSKNPVLGINILRALGFTAALRLREKLDSEQPIHPERLPGRLTLTSN